MVLSLPIRVTDIGGGFVMDDYVMPGIARTHRLRILVRKLKPSYAESPPL